jgi:phosphatidylserine/phosphatidylglycerophosphate/cardiolipin synthase-like enzyme
VIAARTLYRAWRLCRGAAVDLFGIDSSDTLTAIPGWDALGMPAGTDPSTSVLEMLRAIELRHQDVAAEPVRVRLVATVPAAVRVTAATRDVAESLIRSAARELLVVGYSVREPDFLRLLLAKGMAGISVTVVSDRGEDDAKAILESWPAGASPLRAFRSVEPVQGRSLFHAKTIVADRKRTLIGSANFTAGGFRNNIELGIELDGPVSLEIVQLIERLIDGQWLKPIGHAA